MKTQERKAIEALLGYEFKNPELLDQAFAHISYANDHLNDPMKSNERLEFLGDAVLELVSSHWLYEHVQRSEGQLTRIRASLVCEASLSQLAESMALGRYLRLGKSLETMGGRDHPAILEDLMESLFGAIYLDGGLEAVSPIIERLLLDSFDPHQLPDLRDAKSKLQELIQEKSREPIEYRLEETSGPPHMPTFVVSVHHRGECYGTGRGSSKKEAEQNAAAQALARIRG